MIAYQEHCKQVTYDKRAADILLSVKKTQSQKVTKLAQAFMPECRIKKSDLETKSPLRKPCLEGGTSAVLTMF